MGKSTGLTISAFMIVLILCISGCEKDTTGVIDPGDEPETYLSPQHSLAWSPDGSMLAYVFDNFLVVKDVETDELRQLTGTGFYSDPAWSPDSVMIAYSSSSYGIRADIWWKNADGNTVPKRVTTDNAADYRPRWSPDGNRIVFQSYRVKSMDIWIKNVDGSGEAIAITTDLAVDKSAEWSPDGTKLAFESKRSENFDIWVVEVDGSSPPMQITSDAATDIQPLWSPDGTMIAFKSNRSGDTGVWVKNADGTGNATRINTDHPEASMHDWSSDGEWIAYVSDETVFVKSSDGTGETIEIGKGLEPRWCPDGVRLAYVEWLDDQYEVQVIQLPAELINPF